jgi:hypothetical protein
MARKYTAVGKRAVINPTQTLLGITSNANVRPCIYYLLCGSLAVPVDFALEFLLQRFTAAGTSTGVTPTNSDPADPAPQAVCGQNHSAEPTYTSGQILIDIPMNSRATQTWVALDEEDQFKLPATAANGAGMQPIHTSFTGNATLTMKFED